MLAVQKSRSSGARFGRIENQYISSRMPLASAASKKLRSPDLAPPPPAATASTIPGTMNTAGYASGMATATAASNHRNRRRLGCCR